MSTSFDTMLNNLHGGSGRPLAEQESTYVQITSKREFYVSSSYNTIIAYEGDTNSQLIVFNCPKYHEGHDLSACTYKKLRWRNAAAKTEGVSDLTTAENANDTNAQLLTWIVPPEAFEKSGNIDLTISCYDLVTDGETSKTAFAWNTGTFSELKIGKTLNIGGIQGNSGTQLRQPKNEILFVDLEHRSIVAPEGYNHIIASYGEAGITKVYFETPKFFKNIDLTNATIKITATLGNTTVINTIAASDRYTPFANDSNGKGLIGFCWNVPTDITCNAEYKTGAITLAVAFEITGGKVIRTAPYSNLKIRESYIKDSGPFSQSKSYFLDGNSNTISDTIESIGGIVKLRRDEDNSSTVNKNELILCFDPTTKEFSGIKLGTADDQDLVNATNIITSANIVSALGFTPANADEVLSTSNVDQFVRLVGGKIPATYLPSYVDDVVFFESADLLTDPEQKGEPGKIYFVTGSTGGYRWAEDNSERGGSFVLVTSNLALGTTETTAYRGDRGNAAYTHSQVTSGNPHGVTTTEIGALPTSGGTVSGAIHYKQGAETGECAISYDATKKCIKFSFS